MPSVFQEVVDSLNLEAATARGSERNDLLPARHEDRVAGELGKRFSEGLRTRLERGRYDPVPAVFIYVPKPGHTTRPAALLTLADRVIYDALVDELRPRIDAALVSGYFKSRQQTWEEPLYRNVWALLREFGGIHGLVYLLPRREREQSGDG